MARANRSVMVVALITGRGVLPVGVLTDYQFHNFAVVASAHIAHT